MLFQIPDQQTLLELLLPMMRHGASRRTVCVMGNEAILRSCASTLHNILEHSRPYELADHGEWVELKQAYLTVRFYPVVSGEKRKGLPETLIILCEGTNADEIEDLIRAYLAVRF